MTVNMKNSLFGIISLLIGIILLLTTFGYKQSLAPGEYGKMFYPRIVLGIWIVLSLLITVQDAIKESQQRKKIDFVKLICAALIIFAACILLIMIGFIPSGILFFIAYSYISGYKKWKILVPVSVIYTTVIWFVFTHIFFIQLP